jgi:hypothetical protein
VGDRAKADAHFARYIAFRKQNKDQVSDLRESIWLYSTGRAQEARQKAAALPFPAAKTQIAIWDAVEGKGTLAFADRPELAGWKMLFTGRYSEAMDYWGRIYEGTSLINGNEARVLLGVALHGAKRDGEAQALLAKWPLPPAGADPGFSSVVFAKTVELKAGRR